MARIIVVTSGKGGVGKTTVCANFGAKLSRAGLKVTMMDLDIGLNNLDVACGIEHLVSFDLIDVIDGRCRATQALIETPAYPNLYVMPSARGEDQAGQIDGQSVRIVAEKLATFSDVILIDCPAGIGGGFMRSVSFADEAIVVTTPHVTAIRDADKVINILQSYRLDSVSLVVNKARGDLIVSGDMLSADDAEELLRVRLLGVIPEDDGIHTAAAQGGFVNRGNQADVAFNMMAENFIEGSNVVFDCTERYRGFLGGIRRMLKKTT